ncbi:MAG: nuclear transport factor 2 family protein [Chloroflexi bacterium]|nr:nuclear transport factor 2 family protein [Chloroflexota bacterium]
MEQTNRHTVAELAKRLEALEAERDILRTMYRYGHAIDYGLEQQWLDCFTDDAVFDLKARVGFYQSTTFNGREALAAFIARSPRPPAKYRKHMLIEPLITLHGDSARVQSYYMVLHEDKGVPFVRAFGRYIDTIVRRADGIWRIKERLDELEAWDPRPYQRGVGQEDLSVTQESDRRDAPPAAKGLGADQLQARLALLEEERAILRTLYRYGHSIDYGLEHDWVDCFTEDGAFDVRRRAGPAGKRHAGRAALAAFVAQHTRAPAKYHKHLLIEPVITSDSAQAKAVSYFARLDESAAKVPFVRSFGRYHDTMLKCADGRWRFKERIADVEAHFDK